MKTQEELNALKKEIEALEEKLAGLTEEELKQVTGGVLFDIDRPRTMACPYCKNDLHLVRVVAQKHCEFYKCPVDGELTYYYMEGRWARGWDD